MQDMGVGDPQAFAASMLKSVSSGDFSAFDELLGKARAQRQRLQSLTPPAACGEHHRLALSLSADSVTMLERLKAALMKGDSMALMAIATEGRDSRGSGQPAQEPGRHPQTTGRALRARDSRASSVFFRSTPHR